MERKRKTGLDLKHKFLKGSMSGKWFQGTSLQQRVIELGYQTLVKKRKEGGAWSASALLKGQRAGEKKVCHCHGERRKKADTHMVL